MKYNIATNLELLEESGTDPVVEGVTFYVK